MRPDSLQMVAIGNKTTHCFGRERTRCTKTAWHGLVVRNSLLSAVGPPSGGTACILSLCLLISLGPVNFLSIYAPILCSLTENRDEFYKELESSIRDIPVTEHLYLLWDFNGQVGAHHASWPSCNGHFGISKLKRTNRGFLSYASSRTSA